MYSVKESLKTYALNFIICIIEPRYINLNLRVSVPLSIEYFRNNDVSWLVLYFELLCCNGCNSK